MNFMKSTASLTRFEPFGTTTRSPPINDAEDPAPSRKQRDAELHVRIFSVARELDVEVARSHHSDFARSELKMESRAVFRPVACVHVARLDHVAFE